MNVRARGLAWLAAALGLAPLSPCFAEALRVTPAAVPVIGERPVRLSIRGFRGAPHVAWDWRYLDVSELDLHGSSATFSITKVSGGPTQITVSDDGGQSVSVPVDAMPPCAQPQPPISLIGEDFEVPSDAAGSNSRRTYLFFYSLFDFVHAPRWPYPIRLHGSDGSLLKASALQETSSLTRSDVAIPAAPAPGAGVMLYAEFGSLPAAVTYDVQLFGGCESPIVLGTFTTMPGGSTASPPAPRANRGHTSG